MDAKQIIFSYLSKYKPGEEFHSYDLKNRLLDSRGILVMDGTAVRYIREFRDLSGVNIECIKKSKSLYKVISS